jgi:glucose/arabinose dehydrogenase
MLCAARTDATAQPAIQVTPVIPSIDSPVAITHAGDGSGRLFITLQGGRILIYDGQQLLADPFLDISALVSSGGERGLLSVAFHPDYAANGLFYVDYTDLNGDTIIARYRVSVNPDVADPASAIILFTIPQPFSNHNGGQLQFGPDGNLYIGMGDGGSGGDPLNHAQRLDSLLGKILRIDVGSLPYGIPADNPFLAILNARPEIWAYGLRNPWRFSFDRRTGDLFIADVGQSALEEVNFQLAASSGGENYGWRLMEGSNCFSPAANCNDGSLALPVVEYDHGLGCSVTGGYRYRGLNNPGMSALYFYGDFCSGRIWGAAPDAQGNWATTELLDTDLQITAFGEDEDGELLVASFFPGPGAVYRISEAAAPPPAPPTGNGGSGGGSSCFISAADPRAAPQP